MAAAALARLGFEPGFRRLMDVKARNADIDTALGNLFQFIDDEAFDAAHEQIDTLSTKLGADDPELARARTLMAFLEN